MCEALERLRKAEAECSQLIKEVEEYNWDHGPYPLGVALPYPPEDIDRFHQKAKDAFNLKTAIIATLEGLGAKADQWRQQISATQPYEVYIDDPMARGAKRPDRSGLTAIREVLRTAIAKLETFAQNTKSPSRRSPRTRSGPIPRDNCKIKEIAEALGDWRNQLPVLCGNLDDERIPISKKWRCELKGSLHDWTESLDQKGESAVIESIKYSIRHCKQSSTSTPRNNLL